jgi:hypothetical protein
MGAIALSKEPQDAWVVAGWAFRQILDDTITQFPNDRELIEQFQKAKALSGLMVYMLRPELAIRVKTAVRYVARGIISGDIRSGLIHRPYSNEITVDEYNNALRSLLHCIEASDI